MDKNVQVDTNAVISLTMGILAVLLFPFIGWILGLIGLVYSNRSLRQTERASEKGNSMAVVGKVCSIVGIALGLISHLLAVGGFVLFSFRTSF